MSKYTIDITGRQIDFLELLNSAWRLHQFRGFITEVSLSTLEEELASGRLIIAAEGRYLFDPGVSGSASACSFRAYALMTQRHYGRWAPKKIVISTDVRFEVLQVGSGTHNAASLVWFDKQVERELIRR